MANDQNAGMFTLARRAQQLWRMVEWRTPPRTFDSLEDLHVQAQRRLPRMVSDFVDGGSDREVTLRRNRRGFEQAVLTASALRDTTEVTTATTVLGTSISLPVVLGPAGMIRTVHRDAELAVARGAHVAGSVFVVSTASGYTLEEIRATSSGPLWFQLYPGRSQARAKELMERATTSGYDVLVVTIDSPVTGRRLRDARNGFSIPPRIPVGKALETVRHPRWLKQMLQEPGIGLRNFGDEAGDPTKSHAGFTNEHINNPALTWDDISWIRDQWSGQMLIKGVMSPPDAKLAMSHGADGVVVSNHGGRQLDQVQGTIQALPAIRAELGPEASVLIDGGVRSGSDVAVAVSYGADAVLIARPWVWALAADGQAGVERCLQLLGEELTRTMQLLGVRSLAELGPDLIGTGD